MVDHIPPKDFPTHSLVGVYVPADFNRVLLDAAAKNNVLYQDQLLHWAQMGAECSRMHQPKTTKSRRSNR